MIAAVPDPVILEKARRRFFSHLDIEEISGFLVGKGDEIIVPEEGKETNDKNNEDEGESDAIKANPAGFKGSDLAMTGERAEGQQGTQKSCIGDRPLECGFRNLIKEVFEHQVKGSLVFIEKVHLLEEEDDDIDQHQTAQAQGEDLQVFANDISMKDAVAFKHLQPSFSISVG
jgi:hypothetical protein